MAAPLQEKFSLPTAFNVESIAQTDSKICVISVFGKSRLNPFCTNATPLNSVIDKDVFQGYSGFLQEQIEKGSLECYFDSNHKIMYLHLTSFYNTNTLSRCCERLCQQDQIKDFYGYWQDNDLSHAKNLLILFTFSHLVLLCHPGSAFDLSYLRLFHNLDVIRQKTSYQVSDILSSIPGVSKDWANCGRMCTPRMLYLFETPAIDVQPEEQDGGMPKSSKKYPPMRRLQISLEDMIYRVLRKTRAITNNSSMSLFSVPLNEPFVYIQARKTEVLDPIDFIMTQIKNKCSHTKEESMCAGISGQPSSNAKPKPYSASRRIRINAAVPESLSNSTPSWRCSPLRNALHQLNLGKGQSTPFLSTTSLRVSSSGGQRQQEQSLKEFLWQHVEMVFAERINDNMGKHGIEPTLVLPNLGTWLRAVNQVHYSFFPNGTNGDIPPLPHGLTSMLDISMRFSEKSIDLDLGHVFSLLYFHESSRCQKVMTTAENAYQQDLPEFYVLSFHRNRLSKAKNVFSQYARGPAFEKYLKQLEQWCDAYWQSDHQRCEAVSLTGNLCTMKIHRLPNEEFCTADDFLIAEHTNGLKTKSSCNCGSTQVEKDDPFHHKYANYKFYQFLEESCCGHLEHIDFPVFTPTTPEACAIGPTSSPQSAPVQTDQQQIPDGHDEEKTDTYATQSELSLALSLGQTNATPMEMPMKLSQTQEETSPTFITAMIDRKTLVSKSDEVECSENDKVRPSRQISTTEYLSGMIHSNSPPGLLPRFSSFSLCRLGPAGLYSHIMGLDLPGFLPGSSFLLPWDIPVKREPEKWPSVSETFGGGKKRQQRKLSKVAMESSETQTTVRVYLGMEYECPRGHRFFCSGPDKIIKVSANSTVKDNAGRLVHMDMPLYTLCHCKQPKGCMAQMMRVYIVTPKDSPNCPPVRVVATPVVQPNPLPCPQFHPGLDGPLELPSDGLWVLRLPHIYQDDHCVYLMPSDPQQLHSCHLTKGTFTPKIL